MPLYFFSESMEFSAEQFSQFLLCTFIDWSVLRRNFKYQILRVPPHLSHSVWKIGEEKPTYLWSSNFRWPMMGTDLVLMKTAGVEIGRCSGTKYEANNMNNGSGLYNYQLSCPTKMTNFGW